MRLRWGFLDEMLHVDWALPGDLQALVMMACQSVNNDMRAEFAYRDAEALLRKRIEQAYIENQIPDKQERHFLERTLGAQHRFPILREEFIPS